MPPWHHPVHSVISCKAKEIIIASTLQLIIQGVKQLTIYFLSLSLKPIMQALLSIFSMFIFVLSIFSTKECSLILQLYFLQHLKKLRCRLQFIIQGVKQLTINLMSLTFQPTISALISIFILCLLILWSYFTSGCSLS